MVLPSAVVKPFCGTRSGQLRNRPWKAPKILTKRDLLLMVVVLLVLGHVFFKNNDGNSFDSIPNNENKKTTETKSTTTTTTSHINDPHHHGGGNSGAVKMGKLDCKAHGGPTDEHQDEMVYWKEIKEDDEWVSPYRNKEKRHYLSLEVDMGGWNNIRMTVEIAMCMARATGRTFVIPPRQGMYLLGDSYKLQDFIHNMDNLDVMEMQDFLEREVITGNVPHHTTKERVFPPKKRTDWTVRERNGARQLDYFLRNISIMPKFLPSQKIIFVPSHTKTDEELQNYLVQADFLTKEDQNWRLKMLAGNHPYPVNSSANLRLREAFAERDGLWLYNQTLHEEPLIHFMAEDELWIRMHSHFYHALFFEDWTMDLRMKRYVRDKLRYRDALFCAAARIVQALRTKAKSIHHNNSHNVFYTYHIRRGDFVWSGLIETASDILNQTAELVPTGSVVYIATDEKDRAWFDAFRQAGYHIFFLDDFGDLFRDAIAPNQYGIIDQIVAARGEVFVGAYYSSFTAHVNHLRGYYSQVERKDKDYKYGAIRSYNYAPPETKYMYRQYVSIRHDVVDFASSIAWRDLDHGLE